MSSAEARDAMREHVERVRGGLYPAIRKPGFRDADRLIARTEGIISDWKAGRMPDHWQIVEAVNELCVAAQLVDQTLTGHYELTYEPRVSISEPSKSKSIDFLLRSRNDERNYYDVKTVRPREPQDTRRAWAKYEELRELFPDNASLVLAESLMGGEFWHYFSSARAKFLEHTLDLERKAAKLPKSSKQAFRMVFCSDSFRWSRDQLEDFADFYRTGMFRGDDPLWTLQAHYLKDKGIVLDRTISGFCYLKRSAMDLPGEPLVMDVRGPAVGR